MTQTPPKRPLLPPPTVTSFPVKLLGTVAAFLAVVGVIVSVAVFIARTRVERIIDEVETRTGRQITIGSLDISLLDGLAIRDLTITKPGSSEVHAHFDEIQTNLGFLDLLTGNRRPQRVVIRGLTMELRVDRRGVHGFDDIIHRKKKKKKKKKKVPRSPVTVIISNSSLILNLHIPGVDPKKIRIDGFRARARMHGTKSFNLRGNGRVVVDGAHRNLSIEFDSGRGGLMSVQLNQPIQVPLVARGTRFLLSATGVKRSRERGLTTLTDFGLRTKDAELKLSSLELMDAGGRYMPSLQTLKRVVAKDIHAEHQGRTLDIASLELLLHEGKVLIPRELKAAGIVGTIKSRGIHAEVSKAAVTFAESPVLAIRRGRPLDSIASLRVEKPFVRLPTADRLVSRLPGVDLLSQRSPSADPSLGQDSSVESLAKSALGSRALRRHVFRRLRTMTLDIRKGKLIAVDENGDPILQLEDVGFVVTADGDDSLKIGIDARLERQGKPSGSFSIRGTVSDEAELEVVTGFVKGKDIAHFMSSFSEYLSVDRDADVALEFAYTPPSSLRPIHRLRGKVTFDNFGFQAWRICHSPVTGLEGEGEFVAEYDPKERRMRLQLLRWRIGSATLEGNLDLHRPMRRKPRFKAEVKMARQDCAKVVASIPPVMIPRLKGIKVKGTISMKASLSVDMSNPRTLKLKVDGDADSCIVQSLGKKLRIADLKAALYEHHPVEPERGRLEHIAVGPGTREWVPSHMLPRFVKAAAVVTEDRSFYAHNGIRWDLIGRALRMNVRKGRYVYGGSTITQQLVKNLYLTREKTLARKLEELIISGQMERELTKDEILTLYVNVVEFGPDIYGVKRASRFYFAKEPWHLSPLEAAFIMGLKPYPKAGHAQWERQALNSWWIKRVVHVMDMVRRREGAISRLEFESAAPYQPRFRAPDESTFSGRRYVKPKSLPNDLAPPELP